MLEMENANQSFQLEGQQNIVHTFSTISYADGSFDRIVAGGRVYNVGKNSATISDPMQVEFTWRGSIAKAYRDPRFVSSVDPENKPPQANFEVGRKGVVSLLVTNQPLLLNFVDRKAA